MPGRNVIEIVVAVRDQTARALTGIQRRMQGLARVPAGLAALAGMTVIAAAARAVVRATSEAQAATAQLDAAYRSMGATVGVTRERMAALSTEMQRTTTYADEMVDSAQSILLSFDQVRGEAFERTIKVAGDLATRMGTDLTSALRMVGRALQDPERGLMALRRAGVIFSADTQAQIKALVETGRAAEAQNLILAELERRVGGAAAAMRGTLGGALAGLRNAFGDLLEQSEQGTSGLVSSINRLTETLANPATQEAVRSFFGLFVTGAQRAIEIVTGLGVQMGLVGDRVEQLTGRMQLLETMSKIARAAGGVVGGPLIVGAIDKRIAALEREQRVLLGLTSAQEKLQYEAEQAAQAQAELLKPIDARIGRLQFEVAVLRDKARFSGEEAKKLLVAERELAREQQRRLDALKPKPKAALAATAPAAAAVSPLSKAALDALDAARTKAEVIREKYTEWRTSLEEVLRTHKGLPEAQQAMAALVKLTQLEREELASLADKADEIRVPDVVGAIFEKLQGQAEAARTVMEGLRSDVERQREELTEQIVTLEKFRATYASLSDEELVTLGVDSREVELAGQRVDELRAKLAQVPQTQAIADGIEVIKSLRTETELLAETMAEQQAKLAKLLAVLAQHPQKNSEAIRAVMDAQAEVARRTTEQMEELRRQSDESSAAAKRAAEQIQDAFANAFRSLSRFDKPRDILRGFLEAIREIPIQIAAERIGAKIRESLKLDELFDKLLGGGAAKPALAGGGAGAAAATVLGAVLGGTPAGAQAATAVTVTTPVATTQAATAILNTATVTAASLPATAAIAKITAATATLSAAMCQASVKAMVVNAGNVVVNGGGGGEGENLIGSLVGGFTSSLFAAGGGAVPKNRAVLVGEEGPEVIVPSADAKVFNQRQLQFAAGALRMIDRAERVPRDEVILPAQQSLVINQRQAAFRKLDLRGIGASAGGGLIPGNRPRLVHAGEAIIPAQQQQALMAGGGGNVNFSPVNNITVQGTGNAREDQERMAEILELNNARQMERFARIMERNGFGRLRA